MTETDSTSAVGEQLAETVSIDRLYSLLSHPYRRFVLAALARRDEPTALATLAEELLDRWGDGGTTPADAPGDIRTRLYHVHVPKLAEADLVEFDPATNTVAPPEDGPDPAAVVSMLSALQVDYQ